MIRGGNPSRRARTGLAGLCAPLSSPSPPLWL